MRYLILITLVVLSCKSTSKNSQNSTNQEPGIFNEIAKELTEDYIMVKIKNTSNTSQVLLNPMEMFIERNENGEWKKVSVLYCDCGGPPCPAPPSERSIEANGVFNFKWDLMIEECKSDETGRVTIKERAPEGTYRATYKIKSESGQVDPVIINFSL